ncbi:unnamed protein product [Bursaphelenchus okinawaensis]|uniref:Uncharacterized protein n=1 Tax=Bursaphelenchus okinawaensis TaxID=465554 RepID=A0A811JT81_9BILA|nr:unnamed protein product [Bursaphelenchus okinawaensis]CAG9081818.1 unnamed protein product [Bursaphelenchus okinawaensis]
MQTAFRRKVREKKKEFCSVLYFLFLDAHVPEILLERGGEESVHPQEERSRRSCFIVRSSSQILRSRQKLEVSFGHQEALQFVA